MPLFLTFGVLCSRGAALAARFVRPLGPACAGPWITRVPLPLLFILFLIFVDMQTINREGGVVYEPGLKQEVIRRSGRTILFSKS